MYLILKRNQLKLSHIFQFDWFHFQAFASQVITCYTRFFFYQFQFESSHYHHHHHQHLHHYQHRIVIIIKRILSDHPSTNNLSFFLPGEKYHIKARMALM